MTYAGSAYGFGDNPAAAERFSQLGAAIPLSRVAGEGRGEGEVVGVRKSA
jgi:hypothetical protein